MVRFIVRPESAEFVTKDVCEIIEIKYHRDAFKNLPEWGKGRRVKLDALGGPWHSVFHICSVEEKGCMAGVARHAVVLLSDATLSPHYLEVTNLAETR